MASCAIFWNLFEKQWTENRPQYLSGLSRALFPTTFLELAVYTMMAKPIGAPELHYPMIQFLIICIIPGPVSYYPKKKPSYD